jgi:hypothetical protein
MPDSECSSEVERVALNALVPPPFDRLRALSEVERLPRRAASEPSGVNPDPRPELPTEKTLAQSHGRPANGPDMLQPETLSQFENIKKRAGYLWRFL